MADPNDLKLLDFPNELYVGTKNLLAFNLAAPPLAFASPFGTDKAFLKRKETVDYWCGDGTESVRIRNADDSWAVDAQGGGVWKKMTVGTTKPQTISNTPLSGFTFDRSIARDRTSNKVFRITDPRGFQLEISAENLTDIILHSEIKCGEIIGEFIWGRLGGTNFLTRMDHPSYLQQLRPAISRTTLQPGDHVFLSNKPEELIYCGEFYIFRGMEHTISTDYGGRGDFTTHIKCEIIPTYDKKPFKVFKQLKADAYRPYSFLRNPNKVIINSEGNTLPDDMPLGGNMAHLEYSAVSAFFNTKEEMLAFQPTFNQMLAFFDRSDSGSYRYTYVPSASRTK